MKIFDSISAFIIILFLVLSCDHGIDPGKVVEVQNRTGISGSIFYQNWPSADSLENLKLAVYKNYPPQDLLGEIFAYYPENLDENLPYNVDSFEYILPLDTGFYNYIVVAQQYGDAIYFDWWVVGQYDTTLLDSIPTGVTVYQDSMIENINIYVDFDSVLFKP